MKKKEAIIMMTIVCFLLTVATIIQLKTIKNAVSTTSISSSAIKLRDEVVKWKEKYDDIYNRLENAEKILEMERKKVSENDSELTSLEQELLNVKVLLGLIEVKGRGIVITLNDNEEFSKLSKLAIDPNQLLVHDGDIIQIVSILKNAGAEAISINDQRIVNTTAITCDGYVVRINGEKVGAPFEIKAIGSPEYLKGSLEISGYIETLISDGVQVDIKKASQIIIPKYDGVITHSFIKEIE